MNPQENREVERRLKELEIELNQNSSSRPIKVEPGQPLQADPNDSEITSQITKTVFKVTNWFKGLSDIGKIVVVVVAILVGFSLLRTVFQLVTALISLAFLGVLLYLAYKFFVAPRSPN